MFFGKMDLNLLILFCLFRSFEAVLASDAKSVDRFYISNTI